MPSTTNPEYGWNDQMSYSLHDKLKTDLKTAMRNKDDNAKSTIRQVMNEFPKITVPITLESGKKTTRPKKPEEITNEDVQKVIMGLAKSEKTVLEFKKEPSSPYLDHLELYLPKLASKAEIKAWIENNIDISGFKSPMQAMKPIMQHFGKSADGNMVKDILSEFT